MRLSIPPPVLFALLFAAQVVLRLYWPGALLPTWAGFLGIPFLAVAILLNIWGDALFKERHTPVRQSQHPRSLVMTGPYAWTRNPMFLGLVLALVGIAFLLGSVSGFAAPVLLFLFLHFLVIPQEERVLAETFTEKYAVYKHDVRRWL